MKKSQPQPKTNPTESHSQYHPTRTFEDWQADQEADIRTPEERGIRVGNMVMWRHRTNQIIMTERAVVLAIEDNILTLQVKDVETRTCTADICEIVTNQFVHGTLSNANKRAFYSNQIETAPSTGVNYTKDDALGVGLLTTS